MDPEEIALLNRLVALVKDPGPYKRGYQTQAVLDAFHKVYPEQDVDPSALMANAYSWVHDWRWCIVRDETDKELLDYFLEEARMYVYARLGLSF